MTDTIFSTQIPIIVLLIFIIGLFFVFLEIKYETKGIFGILGGLCEIGTLFLCFITGVPIIEQLLMFLAGSLLIVYIMEIIGGHKEKICSLIQ